LFFVASYASVCSQFSKKIFFLKWSKINGNNSFHINYTGFRISNQNRSLMYREKNIRRWILTNKQTNKQTNNKQQTNKQTTNKQTNKQYILGYGFKSYQSFQSTNNVSLISFVVVMLISFDCFNFLSLSDLFNAKVVQNAFIVSLYQRI